MHKKRVFCYWSVAVQLALIVLMTGYFVAAQSGRRNAPPVNLPPVVPEKPEPTPTPQSAPPKPVKAEYFFRVMSDISPSLHSEFAFPEQMPRWVVERLRSSPFFDVDFGETNATRKKAIDAAKESEKTYIVFLELEENQFAGSSAQGEVWINYYVFSPVTGKSFLNGRVTLYDQGRSVGVLGQSRQQACYPTVRGRDYLLLTASLETAERIMGKFNVAIPPVCR